MEIKKIIVTDMIMAGGLLPAEDGFDAEASADKLADIKGEIIVAYLEEHYPDVEMYADIAIQKGSGTQRPLEVLVYSGEGEIIPAASQALQKELAALVDAGIADQRWAVKRA